MKDPVKERIKYAQQFVLPIMSAILIADYGKKQELLDKDDNTIKTDLKADEAAIENIIKKYPSDSVVTEESSKANQKIKGNEFKWIMDLLDGSRNYRNQIPIFATSIAMQKNENTYGGLVYAPMAKKLFTAVKGKGACIYNEFGSKKISVSDTKDLKDASISTVSLNSYKKNNVLDLLQRIHNNVKNNRQMGCTSLELAYTAMGVFDGLIKPTKNPWGVSAGLLLVQEAGGKTTTFKKGKLSIHVASNPHIHNSLCKIVENYLKK